MLDGAIYRQWLTNVGRCSAYVRIAHLFCELSTRLQVVSPTKVKPCILPALHELQARARLRAVLAAVVSGPVGDVARCSPAHDVQLKAPPAGEVGGAR
jgi:hypothetical protein